VASGSPGSFQPALITNTELLPAVAIDTQGGDDTVIVDSLQPTFAARLDVNTGSGNDVIIVAAAKSFAGGINVDGGPGYDTLEDYTGVVPLNIEIRPQGLPSFNEQGPGPITSPAPIEDDIFPVAGALQAVAVHPFDANVIYVGSVNGGSWRSLDSGASWTPVSDQMPSLSISALAIAPRDRDGALVTGGASPTPYAKLVVYAVTGATSSFATSGGLNVGLLRSDAGQQQRGPDQADGRRCR
jgi:hypothetical protein